MYKKNKLSVVVIRARENFKLRLILSDLFWILLTCTSLINFKSNICNFSILSRKVVNLCIDSYDYGSIYPFLVSRKLPIQYVEINRNLRKYETASSYNIKKLVKLTIEHVIKFNIIRRLFFNSERKNNYKIKIQTFINCQKNKNLMGKIQ